MNTGTEVVRSRSGLITTVARTVEGEPTTYALEGVGRAQPARSSSGAGPAWT